MNKRFITIIILLVFGSMLVWINSCQELEPPKATVIVVDDSGVPVEGAMVVIKAADSDSSHTVVYLASGPKQIADTSWTNDE